LALNQLASNIEAAAQQIATSLSVLEDILSTVDVDCNLKSCSGLHNSKHLEESVVNITREFHEKKVCSVQPGREYQGL